MNGGTRVQRGWAGGTPANGAAASGVGLLSRATRPDAVLLAIAVMILVYIWRVQDILTPLALVRPGILTAGFAVMLYLARQTPIRRIELIRSPLFYTLLGLGAAAFFSVPTSMWVGRSALFFIAEIIPNTIFAVMIALAVRSLNDIVWVSKVILIGAFGYGLFVFMFFDVGNLGRLGNLVHYDSNDFALLIVCSIPFAVYFLGAEKKLTRRLFALACLGLFMLLLIKTGSRGGFLGFIGITMFIMLRYSAIPSRIRLSAAVGGVLVLLMVAPDSYWNQMRTMLNPQEDYNTTELEGRKFVWQRGLGYMLDRPITGVGLKAFPVAEGHSEIAQARAMGGMGFKWSVAHSSFIETGAELGVPGLLLFLGIFVVAFKVLRRIRPAAGETRENSRRRALAQMLMGSFVGFLICGFFLSAQHFSILYALIGLTLGLWKIDRLERGALVPAAAAPVQARSRYRPSVAAALQARRG